jgi:hypothetical protein
MGLKLFGWRKSKQSSQDAPPKRLLMPFSNTADDREALRFAYELAQVFDAQLTVLCLVETPRSIGLQCVSPRARAGGRVGSCRRSRNR